MTNLSLTLTAQRILPGAGRPSLAPRARHPIGLLVAWAVAAKMTVAGGALLLTPVAQAQDGLAVAQAAGMDYPSRRRTFTPGELSRLPEYCQFQMGMPGRDTARGAYYVAALGKTLDDIHHYCRGLRDVMFSQTFALPANHRHGLLTRAAGEVEYMVKTNPDTLVLMPEIHYRLGEIMLDMGRVPEAQAAFEKSRALKPDYWPAYTRWADFLIKNKQLEQARQVIEEGLKHSPDGPELKQRLARVSPTAKP